MSDPIPTEDFFGYITFINKTFKTPEQRVGRYNGAYQIMLDTFFQNNKFDGDPLTYSLLVKYRERELQRYGSKAKAC